MNNKKIIAMVVMAMSVVMPMSGVEAAKNSCSELQRMITKNIKEGDTKKAAKLQSKYDTQCGTTNGIGASVKTGKFYPRLVIGKYANGTYTSTIKYTFKDTKKNTQVNYEDMFGADNLSNSPLPLPATCDTKSKNEEIYQKKYLSVDTDYAKGYIRSDVKRCKDDNGNDGFIATGAVYFVGELKGVVLNKV